MGRSRLACARTPPYTMPDSVASAVLRPHSASSGGGGGSAAAGGSSRGGGDLGLGLGGDPAHQILDSPLGVVERGAHGALDLGALEAHLADLCVCVCGGIVFCWRAFSGERGWREGRKKEKESFVLRGKKRRGKKRRQKTFLLPLTIVMLCSSASPVISCDAVLV